MPNYDKLPLFPLHAVLFPQTLLPLHIFEERYRLMIGRCIERKEPFGIVLLRSGVETEPASAQEPELFFTGTLVRIESAEQLADGRYYVSVRGESRFYVQEIYDDLPYLTARVRPVWEQNDDPLQVQPVFDLACELFREYITSLLSDSQRSLGCLQLPQDPALLSYVIGASLQVTLVEKQRLLEAGSPAERLHREVEVLQMEREAQGYFATSATAESSRKTDHETSGERDAERTILRIDSSYTQYYFSRN